MDKLELLPDDGPRYELIDGLLIVSPRPVPRHQRAIARLYRILEDTCPGDHEVFFARLDWQLDRRTALQPDLLFVAKDRSDKNVTETPRWSSRCCPPARPVATRMLKSARHAEAGVPQYWLVDPLAVDKLRPSVEVYGRERLLPVDCPVRG